jgi:hypothetical protein
MTREVSTDRWHRELCLVSIAGDLAAAARRIHAQVCGFANSKRGYLSRVFVPNQRTAIVIPAIRPEFDRWPDTHTRIFVGTYGKLTLVSAIEGDLVEHLRELLP